MHTWPSWLKACDFIDVRWLMTKQKNHCIKRSYCNRRPRDPLGEVLRLERRVVISVDTLIRRKLGEPIDPKLSEPSPLTEDYCIKHLQNVAARNPEIKRPLHKTDKELGGGTNRIQSEALIDELP